MMSDESNGQGSGGELETGETGFPEQKQDDTSTSGQTQEEPDKDKDKDKDKKNDGTGGLISIITAAAGAVTAYFGLFAGVLKNIAPPLSIDNTPYASGIAELFVCILVLTVYCISAWTKKSQSVRGWVVAAGIFGVLSVLTTFGYLHERGSLVYVPNEGKVYAGKEKVAGLYRKPEVAKDPKCASLSNKDVLDYFGGDETQVWTDESRQAARELLMGLYVACACSMAGILFTLAELIRRKTTEPNKSG